MERTYAAQVRGADEIKVCGFVENIRNKSKMAFIVLKDITGKVQITVEKGEDEALDNAVNQITLDSVITVIGKAVESEYVKLGGVEIYPKQIIIESLAAPLPIDREARKGHERSSIDQRIDYRWIDLRTDANQLMFKAQTVMINAMRQFLLERKFMMHPEAMNTFVYSIGIAVITTLVCLLLGYPAAYILSQKQFNTSRTMVVLFILPMWVNILIRTLATVALFDFLNLPLGEGALVFGMVYNFLPFMIYPIYNTLQKMDHNLIEAAQDLGASPTRVFGKVILPLSMPGVMSGIVMVFMPTVSTFAIAELLTMNNIKLFGTTVQENIYNGMWNYGAALSLIMLLLIGITILFTNEEDGASNESGGVI